MSARSHPPLPRQGSAGGAAGKEHYVGVAKNGIPGGKPKPALRTNVTSPALGQGYDPATSTRLPKESSATSTGRSWRSASSTRRSTATRAWPARRSTRPR